MFAFQLLTILLRADPNHDRIIPKSPLLSNQQRHSGINGGVDHIIPVLTL
jgi:hypothetical protein